MLTGITPGKIKNMTGDASLPEAGGHRIVANLVDDSGDWDENNEFHLALEKRWPKAKLEYRRGYISQKYFKLGLIQDIGIRSDLIVVNLITIHEDKLDEDTAKSCLLSLKGLAEDYGSTVHFHKDELWDQLLPLVEENLIKQGISVKLYEVK